MTQYNQSFPTWRQSLARSLHVNRSKPYAKFFHVANVDQDGFAQSRSMVFRGFAEQENILFAITDIRSDKIEQWQTHPFAQISWYFTQSREQYRINSDVILLGQDTQLASTRALLTELSDQRRQVWLGLSDASREQFSWPHPKQVLDVNQCRNIEPIEAGSNIHKHFVLVCFVPKKVDYLCLKSSPQKREISQLTDKGWQLSSVNP